MKHGYVCDAIVIADSEVERGPVANVTVSIAPDASLVKIDTLGVDIVLRGSSIAFPVEVGRGIGAGQLGRFARSSQ